MARKLGGRVNELVVVLVVVEEEEEKRGIEEEMERPHLRHWLGLVKPYCSYTFKQRSSVMKTGRKGAETKNRAAGRTKTTTRTLNFSRARQAQLPSWPLVSLCLLAVTCQPERCNIWVAIAGRDVVHRDAL